MLDLPTECDTLYIMKTKEEITKEFTEELKDLLKKYDAEIEAEDHFQGYSDEGSDIRIEVSIPSKYDENNEIISEYTVIDLGKYFGKYFN